MWKPKPFFWVSLGVRLNLAKKQMRNPYNLLNICILATLSWRELCAQLLVQATKQEQMFPEFLPFPAAEPLHVALPLPVL